MRVRKPSNKGGVGKFIGVFPSFRLKMIFWYESILEKDYLYLLEFDHLDVLSFQEQPKKYFYFLDGKWRSYTPDFHVIRRHERQIVEVKPKWKADLEQNQRRFRSISKECEKDGCRFRVATDERIRVQPRLDNVKVFLRYQRVPFTEQHQIYCQEYFGGKREAALGEVMEFFAGKGAGKPVVYSLLRWGVLDTDLMVPIGADSVVFLPRNDAEERIVI
jgi:hypothetical protein